jgi:hypothetical protein
MTPFIVCVCLLLTTAVVFYVFYLPGTLKLDTKKTRAAYLHERKDVVYENLRDLNFEYKAGKFPEADYQAMKTSLEEEAAAILAEIAHLEATSLSAGPIGSPTKQKKGVTGAPPTTSLK